jgi:hypothetical protein
VDTLPQRAARETDLGFRISWIGFDSQDKAGALELLGFKDIGEPDEFHETPLSSADIPGGWFILFANDFDFASAERLARLSIDRRVIASQVHEGIMFSAAYGYERGQRVWALTHFAQNGVDDPSVSGSPPTAFASIRRRLTQRQDATITSLTSLSRSPPRSADFAMVD